MLLISNIIIFLFVTAITFVGLGGEIFFKKTGISYYLFLIFIGIVLGPIFNIIPRGPLMPLLGLFSTFTLIMVLFHSGMDMKIKEVLRGSPRSLLQVILYVSLSIAIIVAVTHLLFKWDLIQSLVFGSIIGGETTAVAIIPITRTLNLSQKLTTFLTLESIINSVLLIVVFTAFLNLYKTGVTNWQTPLFTLATNFSIGIGIGIVLSIGWVFVLRQIKDYKYSYVFTIGLLLGTYAITEELHGSGLISVLIFGIALGNYKSILSVLRRWQFDISDLRQEITKFQGEISFLMKTFFFVFLGLVFVIDPAKIFFNLLIGLGFLAILLFTRWIASRVSTRSSELYKDRNLILLLCAQGVTPATLSIVALDNGLPLANTFINFTVYVIILTNIVTTIGTVWFTRKAKQNPNTQTQ